MEEKLVFQLSAIYAPSDIAVQEISTISELVGHCPEDVSYCSLLTNSLKNTNTAMLLPAASPTYKILRPPPYLWQDWLPDSHFAHCF